MMNFWWKVCIAMCSSSSFDGHIRYEKHCGEVKSKTCLCEIVGRIFAPLDTFWLIDARLGYVCGCVCWSDMHFVISVLVPVLYLRGWFTKVGMLIAFSRMLCKVALLLFVH